MLRAVSESSQLRAVPVRVTPIVRDENAFFALDTRHREIVQLLRTGLCSIDEAAALAVECALLRARMHHLAAPYRQQIASRN